MKIIEVICRKLKRIKSEIGRGCLIGRWMLNEGVIIPGIGDMFLRGGSRISEVGESGNLRFRGSGVTMCLTSTDQMVVTGRGSTAALRMRMKRYWIDGNTICAQRCEGAE